MATSTSSIEATRHVGHGVIAVYSDIACPWATVVVERLRSTRHRLGIDVVIDLRPLPLELLNEGPIDYDMMQKSIPVAATVAPDYGFRPWTSAVDFPVTTLPALEAVRAGYDQSPAAALELDATLRQAVFVDHECISLHHVIVERARACEHVDAPALEDALRKGRFRADVFGHFATARAIGADGSPHVFLADGTDAFLPSLEVDTGGEAIQIADDDPHRIEELLLRAAQTRPAD